MNMIKKKISLLGSTGSIGTQTLDVVEAYPERFQVGVLAANRHWEMLAGQARKYHPKAVAIGGVCEEECRQLMQDFFKSQR